ncbi:MAG: FISUMP domain-containing protein [Candidatus Delongbacteria bacterium]|nr:FISUMP domain-containing protein [Candidatus Delongbacteria bacterium]
MYRFIAIITLFFALSAPAQDIAVKSFRCLPRDMDARIAHPVTDQNGDVAALIKVVTTETGFKFEAGTLGIVKTEQKISEIWVYVPYGSRKITIKHPQLGILRNYIYPEAIKKSTVYEMVLTTGKVVTTVEEPDIETQWLIIKSNPTGANVFVNDKLAGTTPFQRKFKEGEFNYRLEKNRYHNKAGKIELSGERKTLDLELKPKFGNIRITSTPENGMQIYVDDENTGETTPATLEEVSSGEHRVKLQSEWYQPQTKMITVNDEQTTNAEFSMQPAFAKLSITAKPDADILIDGDKKTTGSWSGRLLSGIYTVKAEKAKYYSEDKQIEITAGNDETLSFELNGKTGSVDVVTIPMEATVYFEGVKQGLSPLTIKDKLTGSYDIRLEKEGYGTVSKSITINEDETVSVEEILEKSVKNKSIFTDTRDGKPYKTVKIGNQTWMAENLNYKTSYGSWCYDDKSSNCEKYGRLYDWETAKKVCPDGWHLPSKSEFETLWENVGGKDLLFGMNNSSTLAYKSILPGGNSGFSALFAGKREKNIYYLDAGYFWSSFSPTNMADYADCLIIGHFNDADFGTWFRSSGMSVRCVKDEFPLNQNLSSISNKGFEDFTETVK